MVTDWVGGRPLVSTVNASGALTTRRAVALIEAASCTMATRLWVPSASAVAGVKRHCVPLTTASPSQVLPS